MLSKSEYESRKQDKRDRLAERAEEIYFSDKDVADMTEWEQKLYWMHKRIEDQRFEYSMDAADEWEVDDV